jgi:hypothetical protein
MLDPLHRQALGELEPLPLPAMTLIGRSRLQLVFVRTVVVLAVLLPTFFLDRFRRKQKLLVGRRGLALAAVPEQGLLQQHDLLGHRFQSRLQLADRLLLLATQRVEVRRPLFQIGVLALQFGKLVGRTRQSNHP